MLFVLLALWTVAALLILTDFHNKSTRYLSAVALFGGFGALASVTDELLLPFALERGAAYWLEQMLSILRASSSLLSYYGVPFAFILFALHYNPPSWPPVIRQLTPWLLAIPIGLFLGFTPSYSPDAPISFSIVALWAVPVIWLGVVLVITKRETNPLLRRTQFMAKLAVVPALLYISVMNYILPSFGMLEMWRYNIWIIGFAFAVFMISMFTYGFMGMQILIQRRRMDNTLRVITSGTSILNHAIKNDVGKMKLFAAKIYDHAINTNQQELAEDIKVVQASAQHIQEMLNRVQDLTQEMNLVFTEELPEDLIAITLQANTPTLQGVKLELDLEKGLSLFCDKTQIMEILHNVIMNAVEALPPTGGEVKIRLFSAKKWMVIEIKDNGKGLEKQQLKQVFEPFYTTKSRGTGNFGLGLAYCYNMMRRHNGYIHMESQLGEGTVVTLHFPKLRKKSNLIAERFK